MPKPTAVRCCIVIFEHVQYFKEYKTIVLFYFILLHSILFSLIPEMLRIDI